MKHKKIIILILIPLLVLALILLIKKLKTKNPDVLKLYGNIEIRQVDLGFRVEGRVIKLLKEEGDEVKKGELLALLDDISYRAKYEKSLFDVVLYSAQSENAKNIYNRNIMLCKNGATSKQECDEILKNKKESLARLNSGKKQSEIYKDDLDNTKIYAPNDGIITTRIVEEGAMVNISNPIYTLSLNKPVWIRTYITEKNLGNIKYNMRARVLTDTIDPKTGKKREYQGKIGYISPVAEFTPKTVQTEELRTDLVYAIRVYVDETDKYLRQGMPTTVLIDLEQEDKNDKRRWN